MTQRQIEFSSGGCLLRGIYHEVTAGPAILCLHGLTLSHDMFADLGLMAERAGISLLRFHMRGHHDSGGELKTQGFLDEVADALAGMEFLKQQSGIDSDRLGLLGFSLGGAVAAVATKKVSLKALATWGSLFDTQRWKDARFEQYRTPQAGPVKIWDDIEVSSRLFSEAIACNPYQDALDFAGPMFLAHGGRDRNHPQNKSIELVADRKALGKIAEGFFPERSGHKFQVPEDWKLLNEKTFDFFKANL